MNLGGWSKSWVGGGVLHQTARVVCVWSIMIQGAMSVQRG